MKGMGLTMMTLMRGRMRRMGRMRRIGRNRRIRRMRRY